MNKNSKESKKIDLPDNLKINKNYKEVENDLIKLTKKTRVKIEQLKSNQK